MYVVEPSEFARSAAGRQVLVRESNDGVVTIEHKGVALPARAFPKDGRVDQAAIVENKVLAAALNDARQRQQARMQETLAQRRLTLRDEDLLRRRMGEEGLSTRRPGPRAIRDDARSRHGAEEGRHAGENVVDQLVAQTVSRLAAMTIAPEPRAKSASRPRRNQEPRGDTDHGADDVPTAAVWPSTHQRHSRGAAAGERGAR